MSADQFGYRSYHFVAELNDDWLRAPNYRGLKGLKFEIQVRTILMHGWATISHKLSYKKETDIPKEFRRNLFRLSALIELADEQFEQLRTEREEYTKKLIITDKSGKKSFDANRELNVDSLVALLEHYFPDRNSVSDSSDLLNEIRELGLSLADVKNAIEVLLPYLPDIERDAFPRRELPAWNKSGVLRSVMDQYFDAYFSNRRDKLPKSVLQVKNKWRNKLRKLLTNKSTGRS